MPYCIVLTKEGSSHLISFVPSTWVKDSILFWPRLKKKNDLELLRRNENSMPAENWKKITCKIKVDNINTISEALKLEELYSNFQDTEDEESYHRIREINRKHPTRKIVTDDLIDLNQDFNLIAETQAVTMDQKNTVREVNEMSDNQEVEDDNIIFDSDQAKDMPEIIEKSIVINTDSRPENCNEELVTLNLDNLNEIMSENRALTEENKFLKESIQRFQNLEQETKRGFAVMQVQLDKLFYLLAPKISSNVVNVEDNTKKEDDVLHEKNIEFPLKSVEELDLLEKELLNVDFAKALVKKFSNISGTSGTHKIAKIGLQISKSFFTDELLSNFTWKGIKGSSKPPFMPYINIRNCFYKIAHLADNSCTAIEVDSFLQNSAIKHSSQRIKRKSTETIISDSKKKRTKTNNNTGKYSSSSNNMNATNNLKQEENKENDQETSKEEEEENLNSETLKKEKVFNYNLKALDGEEDSETEEHLDGDTPDTKKGNIKASKLVTVLSDVKITNKVMDLKKPKAANISSDDLSNSHCFD